MGLVRPQNDADRLAPSPSAKF